MAAHSGGRRAGVARAHLPLHDHTHGGRVNAVRVARQPHVPQHHHAAEQQRSRVRHPLARNVRRGAVHLRAGQAERAAR